MESSCERGNEPSGSIKCWELPSGCTTCGISCGTQLHRVSYLGNLLYDIIRIEIDFTACNSILRVHPQEKQQESWCKIREHEHDSSGNAEDSGNTSTPMKGIQASLSFYRWQYSREASLESYLARTQRVPQMTVVYFLIDS
jgi:hypothetical protein